MLQQIIKRACSLFKKEKKSLNFNKNSQLIQNAIEKHVSGNLKEAGAIYQSILNEQPDDPNALHLLGLISHQTGNNKIAIDLIEKAIAVKPDVVDFYFHCGSAYQASHNNELAIERYEQALAINPKNADVLNNLGLALHGSGRQEDAIERYEQALVINPDYAEVFNNLGNALRELDKQQEAINHYEKALILNRDFAEAYNNLGLVIQDLDRQEESTKHFKKAIVIKPDYAEAHNNLGNALKEINQQEEAIKHYKQALIIRPDYVETRTNLGLMYHEMGELEEAIKQYEQALIIRPDYAEAHYQLGNTLQELARLEEAIKHYQLAISIKPDYAEAHYNMGLTYLLKGALREGWRNYEWRYKTKKFKHYKRVIDKPKWNGTSLKNRTILIHAEQGLGDTIQFIRYAPIVANTGGNVIVECHPGIIHLFESYKNSVTFIGKGEPLPDFDVHCSLLSLPGILNTTIDTIPSEINYIHTDKRLASSWKEKLSNSNKFKIGIFWQGNKNHNRDKFRSIPLKNFESLLSFSEIDFINLQKGEGHEQVIEYGFSNLITDYTAEMDNEERFSDTAALMQSLDLVIGTDTAIIHLAGAMGIPTWLLLPFHPDWRWMLKIEDTPWYPTMRLFRQEEIGNWHTVVKKIERELEKMICKQT
jgi:tetratricopeptide (TPR) repeat protein